MHKLYDTVKILKKIILSQHKRLQNNVSARINNTSAQEQSQTIFWAPKLSSTTFRPILSTDENHCVVSQSILPELL